ncbi:hypothetical protein K466DRAFT_628748, partial [Polyporus arcularius HHB13444]
WGGHDDYLADLTAGVPNARDWQKYAREVVENAVRLSMRLCPECSTNPSSHYGRATAGSDSEDDYDRARQQRLQQGKSDADGWRAELQRYEADLAPEVTKKTDLVQLWSKSTGVYPTLARMALDVLPIPAASTGAESLFSRAKEVTTDRRSRLDPDILEEIECLSWHWKGTLPDYATVNEDTVEVVEGLKEYEFLESQEALFVDDEEDGFESE